MNAFLDFWKDCKLYFLFLFIGGFGGIASLMLLSRRLRFWNILKAFCISAFSGFLGGVAAKACVGSIDVQFLISGMAGFAGGFGMFTLYVFFAKRLGLDVPESIREAGRIRDAIEDANETIFGGCDDEDEDDYCEAPTENSILTFLVHMGVCTPTEARLLCQGQGKQILNTLFARGCLTVDQYEKLVDAFFGKKDTPNKALEGAEEK